MQNELTLRQIVDGLSALVAVLTPDGAVEIVNRQVLDYFGKTLEEMREWSSSDAVHPDDLPAVIAVWTRSIESGQPYDGELRQRGADGVYRWFHAQGLPVRDAEGCILRWFVVQTDVDERKKAAEKVRRREEYLTKAQHLSRTGSFGCNGSSGEMFWSDETFRIFGYDRATKPAVEAFLERVHPEDKARVQEQIVRATREGKACDLEYRLLLPDDSVKHVHVVADASKDEPGGFDVVGAVMDVSAAKEAGERIRKDERELATTIETIPALVLSFLADGTVDFVSHRWLEYVGLSREALFPTRGPLSPALDGEWKLTNHPDDLDRALSKWQASLATGEPLELETRYRRADGHYRWFLVRAVPLRDEIGTIVKWYATFSDIDDRKRAEDAIDAARSELARVARATTMSALTASIAHEVNQPLSGIITNAGTCLRMLDASPPDINGAREIAKRTMRDANRAADVIARLRHMFSKKEFTLEPMDLNEVTRDVMALLSNDLQRNGAVLQVELADDLPLVNGDRIQLQQVILNLVRNASDAMIDVHDRPRQLLITTDREDGRVRLRVRDAGVGLSPKNIDSLFDPFYTTKSGGMGIGLFVSRSIIERHHGNLWAEPNQGLPGATFSFSIPHGEESPISTANTSQRS